MDFNKILDCLGHFGLFQGFVYCLVCVLQMLVGIHMLSNVFLMAEPKHRCYIPQCDNASQNYEDLWIPFAIPNVTNEDGSISPNQCEQYNISVAENSSCAAEYFSNETLPCQYGFIWDKSEFGNTIISELKIICEKSWSAAASQSSFMAGGLIGAAGFGYLADRFGRQKIILVASVILGVTSVGAAFCRNLVLFSVVRFITAASINGLFTAAFIIGVEFIGVSKRLLCANILQIVFAVGELVLVLVAYFVREWSSLELALSVPGIMLLAVVNWFLPESVRWLLAKGRDKDAKKIILQAAKCNRKVIPDELLESPENINIPVTPKPLGPLVLFGPQLRVWSLTIFFVWIVNAMVYYGLSLNAANLGGNVYISFAALSAVEIPAVLLATVVLYYCGRRLVLCGIMVAGGLACVGTIFIPEDFKWVSTMLAVIGKGAIAASFAIIYIYTAEIFPTSVRSTGLGVSSTFARIGSIVAPLINESRKTHESLPMIIFGVASTVAGILALVLPETHNKQLPETIEDVERLSRRYVKGIHKTTSSISLQRNEITEQFENS